MSNGPRIVTLEPGEDIIAEAGTVIRLRSHRVKSVLLEVEGAFVQGIRNHGMLMRARIARRRGK